MERKIYEPVRAVEKATGYCPLYLAWHVLNEARDYQEVWVMLAPVDSREKDTCGF
jgi:hypothetical protein